MSEEEERPTLVRMFQAELAEGGDGRTIDARVVPYNTPARVADPPGFEPYEEMFMPGAFQAQTRAADRVKIWLNFEHDQGLRGIVGHGVELQDRDEGLYGSFRVHENADGDKALGFVREGLLTGLSLEFASLRAKVVDGVVQRTKAHIDKVSLCRFPAYAGAEVLAVREAPVVVEADRPAPLPDEMLELLERHGIDTMLRAFTTKPWDGSASKYTDTNAYCAACLIDDNPPGAEKVQGRCHLPIKEPNGDVNINAVRNALARVGQVQASAASKGAARTRLQQLLAQFNKQSG